MLAMQQILTRGIGMIGLWSLVFGLWSLVQNRFSYPKLQLGDQRRRVDPKPF